MGVWLLFYPGCSVYEETAREPESFPKPPSGSQGVWVCTMHLPLKEPGKKPDKRSLESAPFFEILGGYWFPCPHFLLFKILMLQSLKHLKC